jgi:hypothetical protein
VFPSLSLLRRFHRPTGLTPESVLWLWLDVVAAGGVTAELNGKRLECDNREPQGTGERWVFRLNTELGGFNELLVQVAALEACTSGQILSAAAIVIDS